MSTRMKRTKAIARVGALALVTFACSGEMNKSAAPVQLIATNTQILQRIDLAGGTGCDKDVGTISIQAVLKNPKQLTSNQTFNQVRIKRYRVSYVRTDGGRLIPAPFVRTIDTLLTPGGSPSSLSKFLILEADAITQAPFAALLPSNGGRDPDTGRAVVKMDVIIELFGETLAGENLSASTRFPLDFCFNCGGCS